MGKIRITAKLGDITKEEVDAICNPANSLMWMGGGAAGALKRAGGKEIEQEARTHAPVKVGDAVETCAGKLNARWIIHAPTMERPAMRTTSEKVYLATKAALKRADELGAESIAFSGMGTGVGGLSFEEAAKAMVKAVKEFDLISNSLKKIVLCDLNPNMTRAWKSVLEAKS